MARARGGIPGLAISGRHESAKPVITATQMLRSMVESPKPTRAEVTDVANAIYDGTDAIMLSEETAMGEYPVQAVKVMSLVAGDTEKMIDYEGWTRKMKRLVTTTPKQAVAHSAVEMAEDIEAAAIITCTKSGSTTRNVAMYRPRQVLLTITPNEQSAKRTSLTFGAVPLLIETVDTAEELERAAIQQALQGGYVKPGQYVVITAGLPFSEGASTNMIKVSVAEW